MKKINYLIQLLFNAMTTSTFFFLDINGVITNPSFKALWLPLLILFILGLSFGYIMKLFQDYLKSEFDNIKDKQQKLLDNKERKIESLLGNLKEFKDNKYVLRDIQSAINNHASLIELIATSTSAHLRSEDPLGGGIKEEYKPKKINLIDISNEHNPDNK